MHVDAQCLRGVWSGPEELAAVSGDGLKRGRRMFCRAKIWMNSAMACAVLSAATGCSHSADRAPDQSGGRAAAGSVTGSQGPAAQSPAAQSTAIPGTDPAIQRWFLNNGAAKVAFNNALLRAERGVAAAKTAECQPLATSARVLVNVLPKLKGLSPAGQKLAAALEAPVATFGVAASQCLAGDFVAAKATLDVGVTQLADAQATVDEILDGDK
jgi:hypothetical protein